MKIAYRMLEDGGFVAGDEDSSMTSYAYPSSPHAEVAKRYPFRVAEEMLERERIEYRAVPAVKESDRRNWMRLEGITEQDIYETHPARNL